MWVTWLHESSTLSSPLTFDQKVDVFYEQTLGWQLHIADVVANGGAAYGEPGNRQGASHDALRHSGFAVLQICLSYFETVGRYSGASGGGADAFKAGVRHVYPELDSFDPVDVETFLSELYKGARCGLYHNVRTTRVGLGFAGESSIFFDHAAKRVGVNPHRLPARLKSHLSEFRTQLLNPLNVELRAAFEGRFDADGAA